MTGIGFYMVYQIETSGHVIYRIVCNSFVWPIDKERKMNCDSLALGWSKVLLPAFPATSVHKNPKIYFRNLFKYQNNVRDERNVSRSVKGTLLIDNLFVPGQFSASTCIWSPSKVFFYGASCLLVESSNGLLQSSET